ncbi:MAG: hypothetical protein AB3N28_05280 [Kordiimonas sp.]
MKKIILRSVAGLTALLAVALLGFYFLYYPKHYSAREFEQLKEIAYAAEMLRVSGIRGPARRDYLADAIWNLDPDQVRVYPSGVIIRLRGFFSFESGLYIPSPEVAANIDRRNMPIYKHLQDGVYSYKVEG